MIQRRIRSTRGLRETRRFRFHSPQSENKPELEQAIRAAQVATLNPGIDPTTFKNASDIALGVGAVEFSPNFVCLEVSIRIFSIIVHVTDIIQI